MYPATHAPRPDHRRRRRSRHDRPLRLAVRRGEPREKLEPAKYRQKLEHETFSLGGPFASSERKALDDDVDRMKKMVEEYEKYTDPKTADPAKAEFFKWRIDQDQMAVDSAIEEHRRAADSVTDKLAMIAAVVAGGVVRAAPRAPAGRLAGVLGALAATEATMLTKIAVKGAAYSQEEMLVDAISGAVDIVMAIATVGIGNALMRVSKAGVPLTRLAKLQLVQRLARQADPRARDQGGRRGHGRRRRLRGRRRAGRREDLVPAPRRRPEGRARGGRHGGCRWPGDGRGGRWRARRVEGAAGPHPPALQARRRKPSPGRHSGTRTRRRTREPRTRSSWPTSRPGRSCRDPGATARFNRAVQEHLASGPPQADRKLLVEGVGVTVLSDAEFARVTKSATGEAVTVIEKGQPRIVMRESAPLSALREEGIHVAQALDPTWAKHFQLLDEAGAGPLGAPRRAHQDVDLRREAGPRDRRERQAVRRAGGGDRQPPTVGGAWRARRPAARHRGDAGEPGETKDRAGPGPAHWTASGPVSARDAWESSWSRRRACS